MAPRVSVIIPTYNEERYVLDCLRSVFAQTYPHYEVVVVDDGSTDNTEAVLRPYLGSIRYIKQANRGPSTARNVGIRAATGELIAFLDADDLWLPHHLDQSVAVFDAHPDCLLVHGDAYLWADGSPLVLSEARTYRAFPGVPLAPLVGHGEEPFCDFLNQTRFLGPPSTVVARRPLFDEVGFFDETLRFAEDMEFYLQVLLSGKDIRATPSASVIRRLRPISLTRTELGRGAITRIAILRKVARQHGLTDRQRIAVRRAICRYQRPLRWYAMEEYLRGHVATSRKVLWDGIRSAPGDVRNIITFLGMTFAPGYTVQLAQLVSRVRNRFRSRARASSQRMSALRSPGNEDRPNPPNIGEAP